MKKEYITPCIETDTFCETMMLCNSGENAYFDGISEDDEGDVIDVD